MQTICFGSPVPIIIGNEQAVGWAIALLHGIRAWKNFVN